MPKSSKEVKCPECGQVCNIQGLKNHIRLKHKIKVVERTVDVPVASKVDIRNLVDQITENVLMASGITPAVTRQKTLEIGEYAAYYKRDPDKAAAEWEKHKDNFMMWSINENKMIALRRLCAPTEADLQVMNQD